MDMVPVVPSSILLVLDQLCEMERKLRAHGDPMNLQRNIDKMKDAWYEFGLRYEDPKGQSFSETRTDVEATISGSDTDDLVVVGHVEDDEILY